MTWEERLKEPPKAGSEAHYDLRYLSVSFCTCAVSEHQVPQRGSSKRSGPADDILFQLGVNFVDAIDHADWHLARDLHQRIADRAFEVQQQEASYDDKE